MMFFGPTKYCCPCEKWKNAERYSTQVSICFFPYIWFAALNLNHNEKFSIRQFHAHAHFCKMLSSKWKWQMLFIGERYIFKKNIWRILCVLLACLFIYFPIFLFACSLLFSLFVQIFALLNKFHICYMRMWHKTQNVKTKKPKKKNRCIDCIIVDCWSIDIVLRTGSMFNN